MDVSFVEHMSQGLEQSRGEDRTCVLSLQERLGIRRVWEPMAVGVPFPPGMVFDLSTLKLCNAKGERIALQTQTLARWVDGSAKWVLVEFFAHSEPFQCQDYRVTVLDQPGQPIGSPLVVHQTDQEIQIDTGAARFRLGSHTFNPTFSAGIQGAYEKKTDGPSMVLLDDNGQALEPLLSDMCLESQGPIRATVKVEGTFQTRNVVVARIFIRLSFFAGSGFVEMKCTLQNPRAAKHPGGLWDLGDEGSFFFKDLSLEIPFPREAAVWNTDSLGSFTECQDGHVEIYQDSSGGRNWHSTNHWNRHKVIVPAFSGYQVKSNGKLVDEGKRATPTVSAIGSGLRWEGAIEHFWQNFPKAIEIHPTSLKFGLFPQQCQDVYELQGGEQKTHSVVVRVSSTDQKETPFTWVHDRLASLLSPEWYAQSGVIDYFTPRSLDSHFEYLDLIDSAITGENTFFDRREIIDEYGWRNFGDLYGDHEAVGHTGPTPRVSHYNNQYDVINGALIEFYRSGDTRWYKLMKDLACHVMDIDLYHTHEDRPEYNGGMFWHTDHYFDAATASHRAYSKVNANPENPSAYGGGPSNEQNYTTGLLHYYYLTGDPLASEAVLSLANWVLRMDEGSRPWLRYLDPRPTGLASSSASRDYHGPGRGAGNSINALLDAYRLVSDQEYLEKAEELIRRCIHPHDNIETHHLGDTEYRWSYTVFLQTLGKYLDFKIEHKQIDFMYAYAQASLLHYAKWMVMHEVPYQQVIHNVKIPTETWPAQDIRKSNVFKFAAKHSEGSLRDVFLEKSAFFFQSCLTDLRSYATAHLTRPIVLLLVNGYMHASFTSNPAQQGVILTEYPEFGTPTPFTSQLSEIYRLKEMADGWLQKVQSWVSGNRT